MEKGKTLEEMLAEKVCSTIEGMAYRGFQRGHANVAMCAEKEVISIIKSMGMSVSEAKGFLEKMAILIEHQPLSEK